MINLSMEKNEKDKLEMIKNIKNHCEYVKE